MKLFLVTSLIFTIQVSASVYSQEKRFDIAMKDVSVKEVFKAIEAQSDFRFFYNDNLSDVNRLISLNVQKLKIDEILSLLFDKTMVAFKVLDNNLIVIAPTKVLLQQRVTGTVTDASTNEPLVGVSIAVEGTKVGTVTDLDGKYSLDVPDPNSWLVFSYVGYVSQRLQVNNRATIDVKLSSEVAKLDEIVVIGYQAVKKKDLTGATAVINPSTLRVSSNSLGEAIQGLAPGITVRNSGIPGSNPAIEIRGVASFTSANPLYVIDGMISDANSTINTDDIESVQILKDASASAIYGARAANGVIIITTKHGKEGPPVVSFSAKYGMQQIPKRWDVMNNVQYANMEKIEYQNSNLPVPSSVGSNFNPAINTNWQDEVLRNGNIQDYNLSISGGTKVSNYLISGSFFSNKGYVIGNSFDRGSFRINTQVQKSIFTIGENVLLSQSTLSNPSAGNPMYDMAQMLPIIPVKDPKYVSPTNPQGWGIGTTDAITYAYNPVAVNDLARSKWNYSKIVGNAFVEVQITNWLTYRFNAGLETSFDYNKNLRKVGVWQFNAAVYPSSVTDDRETFLNMLFDNILNFNKIIGKHNINGVIGYTQQQVTRTFTVAGRTNLTQYGDNYLNTIGSATGEYTNNGGTSQDYTNYGYLGRLNYIYNDKYLLTLTGRIDQDSRFGPNNKTGFFPSVAVSWRINRESFFKVDWVNDLKLRASYGKLGIITSGGSWDYSAFINSNPTAVFGTGQTINVGAYQATLANPDLKWEQRTTKNIGVDASFLNNRVSLSLDLYNSLAVDNIVFLPVAGYLGNLGGNPPVNAGSIRNKGVEISATYRSKEQPFRWDISANITTIKNKVESVGNRGKEASGNYIDYIQSGNTRSQVGHELGQWFVLQTNGLFQSQDEVTNYTNAQGKIIQPNAKPGDIRYVDVNGDGVINNADRVYVGSPWPKLQSGAQFNAYYKHFSLNIQLIGVFGYKIYNDVRRQLDSYQNTNFRSDISPWTPQNTGTSDPRIGRADTDQGIVFNNFANTSRWLEDGSYVRLRNVELGYDFLPMFLQRISVKSARIYISGQDLLTFTKYKGLDPDVPGANLFERGVDNGHWPSPRVVSLGIQCNF